MTQPGPDSSEIRLQQLTDRFGDFVDETREFMEETRRNREADTKRFDDFVEETRANRQADTKKLDDFMKEVRDDFAHLKGREYERHVSHTLLSPVSSRLGLRRPRLAHSAAHGTSEELSIRLEDLMERHDLFDVVLSDAIVRGTHEGEPAYAVVEISLTVGNRDIARAADRAAILESATGVRSFAVVIGEHIPSHQETRADAMNVSLIQIAE